MMPLKKYMRTSDEDAEEKPIRIRSKVSRSDFESVEQAVLKKTKMDNHVQLTEQSHEKIYVSLSLPLSLALFLPPLSLPPLSVCLSPTYLSHFSTPPS